MSTGEGVKYNTHLRLFKLGAFKALQQIHKLTLPLLRLFEQFTKDIYIKIERKNK